MEGIKVERCFQSKKLGKIREYSLHHFLDAPEYGYGQCSYLRLFDENDQIHCSLVIGKSRAVPLKYISIPWFELTEVPLSIKMSKLLIRELQFGVTKEVFWTDSQVALSYIKSQTRRFKTFVASRIQTIKDHPDVAQWQYVLSKSNPADYGSRGLDGTCLAKVKMWYEGPKFLWEPESSWKRHRTIKEIDTDDPETKKGLFVNMIEVKTDILETLETCLSSWNKMRRVFALVLKFKTNLLRKAFPKRNKTELHQQIGTSEQLLNVAEIEAAGKKIIKMAQSRVFVEEKSSLVSANNSLKRSQKLNKTINYIH